jgi:diaminohydroxyphosphoribosylaminopyrimidine deaminase/5-amino-6-(5-phosphoribosylamino)uracil reductase
MSSLAEDEGWMRQALTLAATMEGRTHPNPAVACLLVRDGQLLSQGVHARAGEPHAEVLALRQLDGTAAGCTAYVSLEPCAHQGRTPPCATALIEARVARVVFAVQDPNPLVAGQGEAALLAAGIACRGGLLADQARHLNRGFFRRMQVGLPYVTLKAAMSMDARIATQAGFSQWITSPQARTRGQELRRRCDGIMVGTETLLADRPRLILPDEQDLAWQPLRFLLDRTGRLPDEYLQAAAALPGQRILVHGESCPPARSQALLADGWQLRRLAERKGAFDPVELLRVVADCGVNHLLLEGGPRLANSFLARDLIQEIHLFIAPTWLGGTAPSWSGLPFGWDRLAQAPGFRFVHQEPCGPDLLLVAERCRQEEGHSEFHPEEI